VKEKRCGVISDSVGECMLQNVVFRGTNEGRSLYIHNKTDFNQLGSLSVDITADSVVDIATYSLENQPIVDSKQTKR